MAVTVDSENAGRTFNAASDSVAFTCSGSNRLIVFTITRNGQDAITTNPTYNAVNLTLITATDGPGATGRREIWGLIAPATGSNTAAVTLPSSQDCVWGISSYNGVDQTTAWGNAQSNSGFVVTSLAITVTSAVGDLVRDVILVKSPNGENLQADAPQVVQYNIVGAGFTHRGASSRKAGAASVQMRWTVAEPGRDMGMNGFNIFAAPGDGQGWWW